MGCSFSVRGVSTRMTRDLNSYGVIIHLGNFEGTISGRHRLVYMLDRVLSIDYKIHAFFLADDFRLFTQAIFLVLLIVSLRIVESLLSLLHCIVQRLLPLSFECNFCFFALGHSFQIDWSRRLG